MRELALAGCVVLVFGLGSYYATDHFGAFSAINLSAGALALVVAGALATRRLRVVGGPHSRRVVLRGLLTIAVASLLAIAMERLAARADVRLDWTGEGRYELSEATLQACQALPGRIEVLLVYDPLDPRIRRTRLLIDEIGRHCDLVRSDFDIERVPAEVDEYGVGSSNSLVLRLASGAYEVVERPSEGTIYTALFRLARTRAGTLLILRGEGQGDLERSDDLGYGGLAAALIDAGYELRITMSAALDEVPEGTSAVLSLGPQRRLAQPPLAALRRYLTRGGRLFALLEPAVESGIEEILAEWGLETPAAVVVDPASAALAPGMPRGLDPVAYNYEGHVITAGLDQNRVTLFSGARSFRLRKPMIDDELHAIVYASPRSWLETDLTVLAGGRDRPERGDARQDYHPLVVAGRYERDGIETRIVAFGDSDLASNRLLRAAFNTDLVLNALLWVTAREPSIVIRPKFRDTLQFPLPIESSIQMLYGAGLLVPELLLVAGGIVWLRRRSA